MAKHTSAFEGDIQSLSNAIAKFIWEQQNPPAVTGGWKSWDGEMDIGKSVRECLSRAVGPLLPVIGQWLEDNLTKDAANIHLIIRRLKEGGGDGGSQH